MVTVGTGSGTFTNYATATYSGPAGALEATSNVVTLEYNKYTSDLIATIDTSEETIASGGSTTLDVYVRNEGPAPDSNYEVVITVPSGTVVTPPSGCTSSGTTVTWAHYAITQNDQDNSVKALAITVLLGISFSCFQAYEYYHAGFKLVDGVYAANFYLATGFHGVHVIIGTIFLTRLNVPLI